VEFLLKAFQEVDDAELHLFGRGITADYEDYLKDHYKKENIYFHGFTRIDKAFNMIDVLIVPSLWYEPLPRVIYEAYSFGIPVIAAKRGGIPEIVDEGKTGLIYIPDSKDDLLEKINTLNAGMEYIAEYVPRCLKKAEDFLPGISVRRYIDIYEDITK
jgi:glycosyltransferase involved in cell wall biosynthesis